MTIIFIISTGAAMSNVFGKSSLTADWVARFNDLKKLNAYAASQPVLLADVAIV